MKFDYKNRHDGFRYVISKLNNKSSQSDEIVEICIPDVWKTIQGVKRNVYGSYYCKIFFNIKSNKIGLKSYNVMLAALITSYKTLTKNNMIYWFDINYILGLFYYLESVINKNSRYDLTRFYEYFIYFNITKLQKMDLTKIIEGYKNSEYLNKQYSLQSLLDRELGEVNSDINLLKRISKPSPPTLEDLLHYYS